MLKWYLIIITFCHLRRKMRKNNKYINYVLHNISAKQSKSSVKNVRMNMPTYSRNSTKMALSAPVCSYTAWQDGQPVSAGVGLKPEIIGLIINTGSATIALSPADCNVSAAAAAAEGKAESCMASEPAPIDFFARARRMHGVYALDGDSLRLLLLQLLQAHFPFSTHTHTHTQEPLATVAAGSHENHVAVARFMQLRQMKIRRNDVACNAIHWSDEWWMRFDKFHFTTVWLHPMQEQTNRKLTETE